VEVVPTERALVERRLGDRAHGRIRGRLIFVPMLLVATILSLLYLGQTSDVATTGYDIADLQTQKRVLEMQNEQLRLKIAQLESLDRIDHEAATRLHMGPPLRQVYVTAQPQPIPSSTPSADPLTTAKASDPLATIWRLVTGENNPDR